ncbi:caffeic acid 3-O-methyltransferase-like protein [Tanacetum coccineum]
MSSSEDKIRENEFTYAMQLVTSTSLSMVLMNTIKLNVFDAIAKAGFDAQLSAYEIASRLSIPNQDAPDMLDRMLRLLASHSIVTCSQGEHESRLVRLYGLAPVARYFINNKDGASLGWIMELAQDKVYGNSWLKLKDSVIDGGIAFDKVYGTHIFEYMALDARFREVFNNSMVNHSIIVMKEILECYHGFNNIKCLVDVGGGLGVSLNMITSKYPTVKGINFDLPHVTRHAPQYPESKRLIPIGQTVREVLRVAGQNTTKEGGFCFSAEKFSACVSNAVDGFMSIWVLFSRRYLVTVYHLGSLKHYHPKTFWLELRTSLRKPLTVEIYDLDKVTPTPQVFSIQRVGDNKQQTARETSRKKGGSSLSHCPDGHWKRNCPLYLEELRANKKKSEHSAAGSGINAERKLGLWDQYLYGNGAQSSYCPYGKMNGKSFNVKDLWKIYLGLLPTDVCGTLRHVSRKGASIHNLTDDFSRYGLGVVRRITLCKVGDFLERDLILRTFSGRDCDLEDDHIDTLPSENTSEIQ